MIFSKICFYGMIGVKLFCGNGLLDIVICNIVLDVMFVLQVFEVGVLVEDDMFFYDLFNFLIEMVGIFVFEVFNWFNDYQILIYIWILVFYCKFCVDFGLDFDEGCMQFFEGYEIFGNKFFLRLVDFIEI